LCGNDGWTHIQIADEGNNRLAGRNPITYTLRAFGNFLRFQRNWFLVNQLYYSRLNITDHVGGIVMANVCGNTKMSATLISEDK
jgi:hypothetical protein